MTCPEYIRFIHTVDIIFKKHKRRKEVIFFYLCPAFRKQMYILINKHQDSSTIFVTCDRSNNFARFCCRCCCNDHWVLCSTMFVNQVLSASSFKHETHSNSENIQKQSGIYPRQYHWKVDVNIPDTLKNVLADI